MTMDKKYALVASAIKKSGRIALCIHQFPDGDAIGSMIGLALVLKKMGKEPMLFCPGELPHRYRFLPLYGEIKSSTSGPEKFDLAIAIDCASSAQLAQLYPQIFKEAKLTIEIDHHVFRQTFADIALIERKAAAVG